MWPNNALGRCATHEKAQGNEIYKSCQNPDKIYCSWNFSRKGQTLLNPNGVEVIEGGAFVDYETKLPEHIARLMPDYDFLGIDYALGRLTVGCPRKCPWCVVWKMWGTKVKRYDSLDNFVPEHFNKVWLLDDNLLAFNGCHKILEELAERKLQVCFPSGLDIRKVTYKKAELLSKVDYRSRSFKSRAIYAAFDNTKHEKEVRTGIEILKAHNIKIELCYALGGFPNGDEFEDLYYRVQRLLEWGVDPYVMPYHNIDGMKANKTIRAFKRMISLRYYRKYVKELGPIEGLKKAWENYRKK